MTRAATPYLLRLNLWKWTQDEKNVLAANFGRRNSLDLSARILRRTVVAVRRMEYYTGLKRGKA